MRDMTYLSRNLISEATALRDVSKFSKFTWSFRWLTDVAEMVMTKSSN